MNPSDVSPFVEVHRIGPLEFNISSPVKPISIRDQMVRAQILVDSLFDEKVIAADRPLLIVGGGAAAATAAVCAKELKVPVIVVNLAADFFTLQEKCISRWIDPTQYDWPAWHWREAKYPWHQPQVKAPLPWEAKVASVIATNWSAVMQLAQVPPTTLEVLHEHELADLPAYDAMQERMDCDIRDVRNNRHLNKNVGCVIYAVGFGRERSATGNFQSENFWESDNLEKPRAGCDSISTTPVKIAVCGAGDGGLQDFIRIATGMKSARDLMDLVEPFLYPEDDLNIASEEEQAQRALLWSTHKDEEHRICSRLDELHQSIVEDLLTDTKVGDALAARLQGRLADIEVVLYHPCDHFPPSYALNRFLVLLLCEWAKRTGFGLRRVTKRKLKGVAGIGHICNRDAAQCRCQQHRLYFDAGATCEPGKTELEEEVADVVVLRLGIDRPNFLLLDGRDLRFNRQILPYFPPQLYG